MKKIVLKLDLHDDKAKQKALKTVSTLPGIDSIAMDMKERKLTVIGTVDPVSIVSKLRKYWPTTDIILVGPAKEPEKEKKEEPKKEEGEKKEEPKKEGENNNKDQEAKKEEPKKEGSGDDQKKDQEAKKEEPKKDQEQEKKPDPAAVLEFVKANYYRPYYYNNTHVPYHQYPTYYYAPSVEENPNACAIC